MSEDLLWTMWTLNGPKQPRVGPSSPVPGHKPSQETYGDVLLLGHIQLVHHNLEVPGTRNTVEAKKKRKKGGNESSCTTISK